MAHNILLASFETDGFGASYSDLVEAMKSMMFNLTQPLDECWLYLQHLRADYPPEEKQT
jgi:hypothetical protein